MENQWLDNGFKSFEAMENSHNVILSCIKDMKFNSIIDFGCGNGELLKNINVNEKCGVEILTERFNRIKINISDGLFWNSSIFESTGEWFNKKFDLAIIMPGRFLETTYENKLHFINWLKNNVENVLFYTYSDWNEKNTADIFMNTNAEFNLKLSVKGNGCSAYLGKIKAKELKLKILL